MKIAIIGYGVIGSAIHRWINKYNPSINVLINDPDKGFVDTVYIDKDIDAYFICINVLNNEYNYQDITNLSDIIAKIQNNNEGKHIFIRSTITPHTVECLQQMYIKSHIHYLPEFLTERTADNDFEKQTIICPDNTLDILTKIFPGKVYVEMSSKEASIAKYAHNIFGALKVTYFNALFELCQIENVDYNKVREGVLVSNYINNVHTNVPGPDKQYGFGGKCFPKDLNAFQEEMKTSLFGQFIRPIIRFNNIFRHE